MMKLPGIKRILPLILTVLLLPTLLAVPARAVEDDSLWFNVLDLGTANNSGSNRVTFTSSTKSTVIRYYLTGKQYTRNIDVVFRTDSTDFKVSSYQHYFTIVDLGDGYYRAYGLQNYAYDYIYITFWHNDGSYIDIVGMRATTSEFIETELRAAGTIYLYDNIPKSEYPISYMGDGNVHTVTLWGDSSTQNTFDAYLGIVDWAGYDLIELRCAVWGVDISSISVNLRGERDIPYQVNYIESTGKYNNNLYIIDLTLDLRELERYQDSAYLDVDISGSLMLNLDGSFSIYSCTGYVITSGVSLWSHWFGNINKWFNQQTTSIVNAISTWGQNIINALGGNNDASGVQDNINAAVGELDQVQGVLDGVARPDLDAIDFDVSGMVDVSAAATYGNIFSTLIGNLYMTNILMIAFILAAASFLLFGRR